MKDSVFTTNPVRLDRQRSVFNRDYQHKMSLEFGKLNLIGLDEVLPGDTFSTDVAYVVRMDTPVAPIMDNIFIDLYHFFVPSRLVWEHWKEFQGESDTAWVQPVDYVVPQIKFIYDASEEQTAAGAIKTANLPFAATYLDQAGVPIETIYKNGTPGANDKEISITALPFRAIQLIYNDYFRDVNNMDAAIDLKYDDYDVAISLTDGATADTNLFNTITGEGGEPDTYSWNTTTAIPGLTELFSVGKFHDLFTSALRGPQRGGSVKLPMAGQAPIITSAGDITPFGTIDARFSVSGTSGIYSGQVFETGFKATQSASATQNAEGVPVLYGSALDSATSQKQIIGSNLVADLTRATAATVNQLRIAIQTQKYLEAMARGGNRYIESLKAIFGVNAPNGLLQRAEYLGGKRRPLNISQVLSTAETELTDGSNPVGQTGAFSLTADRNSAYTKSFVEHGYVLSFAVIRQEHTYTQGIARIFARKNLLDFYVPQLANIGEVPVANKELLADMYSTSNDGVFGYQEAWYEYRYRSSFASGKMSPSNALSLNYWTLADNFENLPTLSKAFIEENDDNLKRALIHGNDASVPQFIADFYFKQKVAREMPLYSIPGLVDHH